MDQETGGDSTGATAPHEENQPIGLVQTGMNVVDAAGDAIGKVVALKMGDPQAVTDVGDYPEDTGWAGRARPRAEPPDLPGHGAGRGRSGRGGRTGRLSR